MDRITEKRIHSLRMGWRNLFPVVLLSYVSFWFWREMRELALHYFPVDCFGIKQEIVFGVTYVLSVQYSCVVVSVFLLWQESQFCSNTLQSRSFLKNIENFLCKKMIPYKTYVQEDQLFLALYGSATIQSLLFLKNIKNFVWFPKQYLLGFFLLEKQLANILDRGFLFLRNTLILHSLLLWRES
jgi:hypothetical protein